MLLKIEKRTCLLTIKTNPAVLLVLFCQLWQIFTTTASHRSLHLFLFILLTKFSTLNTPSLLNQTMQGNILGFFPKKLISVSIFNSRKHFVLIWRVKISDKLWVLPLLSCPVLQQI